jgi:pSer/pThr/pTyr-binding forkhead associated (FHA) protein
MIEIKCSECKNITIIEHNSYLPKECEYCFIEFNENQVQETPIIISENKSLDNLKVIKLIFTHQVSRESFIVNPAESLYIGRNFVGSNILCTIKNNGTPVISRKHCSVELIDNKVYIKDELSTNGTFKGIDKINCRTRQLLSDEDLIYFANDAFVVNFVYEKRNEVDTNPEVNVKTKFSCNDCGDTYLDLKPSHCHCGGTQFSPII